MAEENNEMLNFQEPSDGGSIPETIEDVAEVEEVEDVEEEEASSEEAEEVQTEEAEPEIISETPNEAASLPLDVIEEAIGYGLTSSEIEELGSEENIAAVLQILDRQIDNTATDEPSDSVYGDDEDPFVDSDENPGVNNSEVAELRKQIRELQSAVKGENSNPMSEKLFSLLDNDYNDLFGEVGGDQTKTQKRNRGKVLQELDTMKAGYKARKRAIPSDRRLFKQAVRSVFGDHESKVVKKKFADSAKKRKSQFIQRVNSRDARRPQDGRNSAIDSVKKFLADRGYSDLESVETFD
tara:strand:+ start:549 stop:1436 length:888 start_codon:yes stop_codon:yes gene_type:complete